jgi:hypothetical protein
MRPPNVQPQNSPLTPQSLLAGRRQANSRFLTKCYLFPAALSSARCPKSTQRRAGAEGRSGDLSATRDTVVCSAPKVVGEYEAKSAA